MRVEKLRHQENSGLTLLECVITLPIVLILLICLIDFMRYSAAKNALETSARKALTLAAFIPDLDRPAGETGPDQGRYEAALHQVAERAREVKRHPWFHNEDNLTLQAEADSEVVIVPPVDTSTNSRESNFATTPIDIRTEGRMKFLALPWLGAVRITGNASGFREPKAFVSNPIPLGCNGLPVIPGQNVVCNCPTNQMVNVQTGRCVCQQCPYPSQQLLDPSTCACRCMAPWISDGAGRCICRPSAEAACYANGQPYNPSSCGCGTCPVPQVFDPSINNCICPQLRQSGIACPTTSGGIQLVFNTTLCQCLCPNNLQPQANGECGCAAGQVLNPNSLACECAGGCPAGFNQAPPPSCGCSCQPSSCAGGRVSDANCNCVCPSGTTWNAASQQCACEVQCPPGTVAGAPPSCGCSCPSHNNCPRYENGQLRGCFCGE